MEILEKEKKREVGAQSGVIYMPLNCLFKTWDVSFHQCFQLIYSFCFAQVAVRYSVLCSWCYKKYLTTMNWFVCLNKISKRQSMNESMHIFKERRKCIIWNAFDIFSFINPVTIFGDVAHMMRCFSVCVSVRSAFVGVNTTVLLAQRYMYKYGWSQANMREIERG